MNVVLWIIAGLLAAAFGAAGLMKLTSPKEKLAASGMGWTEDYSAGQVKTIGTLEVLGAIGLILPAALGLVLMMIGAAVTHARRKENPMIGVNVVLLILAAVVAWGRFGPYAFTN